MKINFLTKNIAIIDYNKEGRAVHIQQPNGIEEWREYDRSKNRIKIWDSTGYEDYHPFDYYDNDDDDESRLVRYLSSQNVWFEREFWEDKKRKRCAAYRKMTVKEWLEEKIDAVKESCANKKLEKLEQLVQNGSGKAMYEISEMYANHRLNPKNGNSLQLAHEWNQKSAESGYPPAMAKEGWFHICGWKKPSSLEKAFSYLKAAADSGYKKANMELYECYRYGWGTEPNYEKALKALKLAAKSSKQAKSILKTFTPENVSAKEGEKYLKQIREFYN